MFNTAHCVFIFSAPVVHTASINQQSLWFLQRVEPERVDYVVHSARLAPHTPFASRPCAARPLLNAVGRSRVTLSLR